MATRAEALAEIPLFALLDEQERAALAERLDEASFPAGATIFHTGQPGDALYVVRTGEVEIFHSDTGDRILLETATAGHFFGEISLLDGGARTASAVVTKDAEMLAVYARPTASCFRPLRRTSTRWRRTRARG